MFKTPFPCRAREKTSSAASGPVASGLYEVLRVGITAARTKVLVRTTYACAGVVHVPGRIFPWTAGECCEIPSLPVVSASFTPFRS